MAYEAAPAFDPAFKTFPPGEVPLVWFGIYRSVVTCELPQPFPGPAAALDWEVAVSRETYLRNLNIIRCALAEGHTYQVNYTMRLQARFDGDPWAYFLQLMWTGQQEYAAYVDTGRFVVLSASPELFFELDGTRIRTRPMKGTAPRGMSSRTDQERGRELGASEKNRAENLMIVDLLRNDLGKIARPGSVSVPELFTVESYPTLWQMTSTVEAQTDVGLTGIMQALFPCGSITGAPKVRSMEIIREIEECPRKVYTGCIGTIEPNRRARFNVAIRTVLVDRLSLQAEYGTGGGIVWDSIAADEYAEGLLKAQLLTYARQEFCLLETLRWTPQEGYFLLDFHLQRFREAARYFAFPHDMQAIAERLEAWQAAFGEGPLKVRVLLDRDGNLHHEVQLLSDPEAGQHLVLRLAPQPIMTDTPFIFHKTTKRDMYDRLRARVKDCDDVILWNEHGEITESTQANVVVEREGCLWTPPEGCGLLPGTFRRWLLESGQVKERVITVEECRHCQRIFLVNSVRLWQEAILLPDGDSRDRQATWSRAGKMTCR